MGHRWADVAWSVDTHTNTQTHTHTHTHAHTHTHTHRAPYAHTNTTALTNADRGNMPPLKFTCGTCAYVCVPVCACIQVIVTQPPFNRDAFAKWVEDARRRGVLEGARLLVGHPMIRCV